MDTHEPALRRLIDRVLTARSMHAPLDIRGGSSKAFYGNPPRGEPLDVRGLGGISSYEPTELVVTARCGTPLAELDEALAERGQWLPFEPPCFGGGATVGGMVAAGLAGPARMASGGLRDYVLGATLLDGRGEVLSFGGQVMKNVAGYDVSRLLAGSMGILGVLCEVSLKVLPRPAATATLRFDADAAQALALLRSWAGRPLPLEASAWHAGRLHVRLAGAAAAVDAARTRLGGEGVEPAEATAWWRSLRDQTHPFFAVGGVDVAGVEPGESLWRIAVPATATLPTLPGPTLFEWAGAQRWWRTREPAAAVRAIATEAGGHATLFRGADKACGAFAPLAPTLLRIHRALKASFDPDGLFNRGRLVPDL